jgi:EAL and modified HD-GYP domain-containing signal transduction protein
VKSFIRRLISGIVPSKSKHATAEIAQAKPLEVATDVTPAAEIAQDAWIGIGARRPVIANTGDVVGYEFCIPAGVISRMRLSPDQRVKSAYVACAIASACLVEKADKIGLARIPAHFLDPDLQLQSCAGIWVGIEFQRDPSEFELQIDKVLQFAHKLRSAGAKVGWDANLFEMEKYKLDLMPDFVLLQQGEAPVSALIVARSTWPEALKALPTIATDLRSEEDLEAALQGSISYVCGAFTLSKVASDKTVRQPIPPDVMRLMGLMNLLISDGEFSTVVNDIKGDVGLTYRLLSMMKSANYANHQGVQNIEQAVLTLGRDELYRILSVMLLRYSGTRKVSTALEEIALWRSRFLELLAIDRRESMPGNFFTLGLVSMLGSILKQELADVVQKIALPEPAKQALLTADGPWRAYLLIAMEVEGQRLGSENSVAKFFGGAERVLALSDTAWEWAAEKSKRG